MDGKRPLRKVNLFFGSDSLRSQPLAPLMLPHSKLALRDCLIDGRAGATDGGIQGRVLQDRKELAPIHLVADAHVEPLQKPRDPRTYADFRSYLWPYGARRGYAVRDRARLC